MSEKNPTIENRYARHEYHILDTIEAGIVLFGSEVKSIRLSQITLKEGYALVRQGEVFLEGVHITPYAQASVFVPDAVRSRKLLLHGHEISKLVKETSQKGLTLLPLKIYFSKGKVKVLLGIGKGKKTHDKRESIRARDEQRTLDRVNKHGR